MVIKRHFFLFIFLFSTVSLLAQDPVYRFDERIGWHDVQKLSLDANHSIERLSFEGAVYPDYNALPRFVQDYPLHADRLHLSVKIISVETAKVSEKESLLVDECGCLDKKDTSFKAVVQKTVARKQPYASVSVIPVRWNADSNYFEKLVEFKVEITAVEEGTAWEGLKTVDYAENSVLATGDWFKVSVDRDGIYKITYADLVQMGFDVSVDPKRIAVFGNGGGILPEQNDQIRFDDLVEDPIMVAGEDDGVFNDGDYILFYGKGPVLWELDPYSGNYFHVNNIYDDHAYYFITVLDHNGKRISEAEQPVATADVEVTDFIDRQFHEKDDLNLAGTGRLWVGEYFDFDNVKSFDFSFPDIVTDKSAYFRGCFVGVSTSSSYFRVSANDISLGTTAIPANPTDGYNFGKRKCTSRNFLPDKDEIALKVEYLKYVSNAIGYLDYLELSAYRKLRMHGDMMLVRNEFNAGSVAEYTLEGQGLTIWDVSDPVNVQKVAATYSNGKYIFKTNIAPVKEFMVFTGNEFYAPEFVERVANQNLHAVKNIDYLIITHPLFRGQAERLANFHTEHDGYKSEVVEVQKIYNEFSSGAQDITAIRDFVKMIYDKSDPGRELKYLLLFGDASYDYKDRIPDNTNFVPCWESEESLYIISSIATDDYFGYLDDGEGSMGSKDGVQNDKVDIGIGRLPVDTPEQAEQAVNKIENYATVSARSFGSWRNTISFIADDGDFNIHLKDAEKLADYLEMNYPVYNINKIYLDGFKQISTPSGQKAPEMNRAINNGLEKGMLIFNYSGHGGELGLGHEQFLTFADINSWTNFDKLAVFITATCEFSRYDDPKRVSAGEQVFLNPKGGGIALFSTSRATYASANYALNKAIYTDNLFEKTDGEYPAFGEVIMHSKTTGGDNDKKFILLGDPALKLAYTDYHSKTLKINQHVVVEDMTDTLRAFQHVTIEGEVVDDHDDLIDFNGLIYPTIYDKRKKVVTFGDQSAPVEYTYWSNILFNGKASVEEGKFRFEFVMPKDIGYNFGPGRISYYFNNNVYDGNGYFENFVVGGYDENAETDDQGPDIRLYLNDTLFVSGGITNENPTLFAVVEDESGINTTGNGIGHDIVASIDDNAEFTYVLNDYYESYLNRYDKGTIRFPMRNLTPGWHTLSLKVWDVYNNSSTAYIEFKVENGMNAVMDDLMNYPNPFTDETTFSFNHNQQGKAVEITIDIYSVTGQRVKIINVAGELTGNVSRVVKWDGTTDTGRKLSAGVYPYRLTIKNGDGSVTYEDAKLVIIR
jgi:hypothetical protein